MAMATYLQMVSEQDLAKLRSRPTWVNQIDRPGEQSYVTHYFCSINYFVTGDAWPSGSRKHPLGGLLFGFASIPCRTLECGNFGVLRPDEAQLVLAALGTLDLAAIRQTIADTDPEDLADEEVEDFELLAEDDDAAEVITNELRSLAAFYARAARYGYGVVSYTT